jgi:hypothetical protein
MCSPLGPRATGWFLPILISALVAGCYADKASPPANRAPTDANLPFIPPGNPDGNEDARDTQPGDAALLLDAARDTASLDGPGDAAADTQADRPAPSDGTQPDGADENGLSFDVSEELWSIVSGQTTDPSDLVLTNDSSRDLGSLSVTLIGPDADQFRLVGQCPQTLAAGSSCNMSVAFAPTSPGKKVATVTASGPADAGHPMVSLLGFAAGGPAALATLPDRLDFGAVTLTNDAIQDVTVINQGGTTIDSVAVMVEGAGYLASADDCVALEPAAQCTVFVTFTPASAGDLPGRLTLKGTPGGQATLELHGRGLDEPLLSVTPPVYNFVTVEPGKTAPPVELAVSNLGSRATGALSATLSGPDAASFAVLPGTCAGQPLPASATCTFGVTFTPTAAGGDQATLTVSSSDGLSVEVILLGSSGYQRLTITPRQQSFPALNIGTQSPPVSFTVRNVAADPSGTLAVRLTGLDAAEFETRDDQCTGHTLAHDQTCTLSVVFKPAMSGRRTAGVEVSGAVTWIVQAGVQGIGN